MRGRSLFIGLAESGHIDAVKYLYNSEWDDPGLVGRAFASAACGAEMQVVKFLIATDRVSSEAFDKAFKLACSGYQTFNVVALLYCLKRVSQQGIDRAFAVAHDVAVVKLLYENEKISDHAVTVAFTRSLNSLNQHFIPFEIIKFLHKLPCIPSSLIDEAFVRAAQGQKTDTIEVLRDDSHLTSKAKGDAFVDAFKCQGVEIMKELYDEKCTPPSSGCFPSKCTCHGNICTRLSLLQHDTGKWRFWKLFMRNNRRNCVLNDALDVAGANAK
ncbi:hypothetical protein F441_08932, partial [Phytophthora nicotianae CJ01A1]